jgi:hypothetical protein
MAGFSSSTYPAPAATRPGSPFVLTVSWVGPGDAPKFGDLNAQGAECTSPKPGTVIPESADLSILCRRVSYEPVALVVKTDRGDVQAALPSVSPPAGLIPELTIGDNDFTVSSSVGIHRYGTINFTGRGKFVVQNGGHEKLSVDRIVSKNGAVAKFEVQGKQGDPGDQGAQCASCGSPAITGDMNQFNTWVQDCRQGTAVKTDYGSLGGQGRPGVGGELVINVGAILGGFECNEVDGVGGPGGPRGDGRRLCHNGCGAGHPLDFCKDTNAPDRGTTGMPGHSKCVVGQLRN